ncbi:hypothetical protein BS78_K150100 [Paspalum vaginatum]|uniref:Uncharacterized protein n=1 Tax=Paspalum vaginatum TaxID=158149 RepID=A0A9W8CEI3_9POAL|nr:hypothetical protein BS78_K150100 [Paspalum vaginatum]KAJ1255848.1 hypothetical protein BS78_K150100 [Paspalum vaginatum]
MMETQNITNGVRNAIANQTCWPMDSLRLEDMRSVDSGVGRSYPSRDKRRRILGCTALGDFKSRRPN